MTFREFREKQREEEKRWLCNELRAAGSVWAAAKRIGVHRPSLYRMLARHGAEPREVLARGRQR